MPTVLITGGTGTIGKALSHQLLEKGYEVIILTRGGDNKPGSGTPRLMYAGWNVKAQTIDTAAIQKADYIVHLAGTNVGSKRWTSKRKKEIVESRTQSSALLVKALAENSNQVKAVISASAIGWYGADPAGPNPAPFEENAPATTGFLGETCRVWEDSIEPVTHLGKRLVKLRTGIVLSNEGGALAEFKKPLRFGIAAIIGNGKQIISWIHVDDLCRIYIQAIEDERMNGAYNAVAPVPVTNKELTLELAASLRGRFFIPVHVPAAVLQLVLGEMSIEVLKSATVSAAKIKKAGFQFVYPTIESALKQLTKQRF